MTRPKSRMRGRCASITAHTVFMLRLVRIMRVSSCSSGLLVLEDIDNHLKRLYAPIIA